MFQHPAQQFQKLSSYSESNLHLSVLVRLVEQHQELKSVKGIEYMKTSRGAKARECSCTCFVYFLSRHLFFCFFFRLKLRLCSGSGGSQSSVAGKLDNFFILLETHPTIFWGQIIMSLICIIILLLGALRLRRYCFVC